MSHNLRIALVLIALTVSGAPLFAACSTADMHRQAHAQSQPEPNSEAY